jgi:hypothetical protein
MPGVLMGGTVMKMQAGGKVRGDWHGVQVAVQSLQDDVMRCVLQKRWGGEGRLLQQG